MATGDLLIWELIGDGCENLMRVFIILHETFAISLLLFFQATEIRDMDKQSSG